MVVLTLTKLNNQEVLVVAVAMVKIRVEQEFLDKETMVETLQVLTMVAEAEEKEEQVEMQVQMVE
jgi:hypothetical protein